MWRRLGLVATALVVALGTTLLDARQTRTTRQAAPLSPADIIEIQQLAVRYSYALDTGARDGQMFTSLFAPDGAFISATRGRLAGDALRSLGRGRNPMYPRRFITNHVIDANAEGVTGRVYVIEVDLPTGGATGGQLTSIGGRYEDVYRRTGDGWRFQSRTFVPSKATFRPAPRPGAASVASGAAPSSSPSPAATPQSAARASADSASPRAAVRSQGTAKATPLSVNDYIEIQQLVNRYAYALDTGDERGTGSAYAALFAPDGTFAGPGIPDNTIGREKLAELARIPTGGNSRRVVNYVSHFMTNHLLEGSADGASGKVYLLVLNFGDNGAPHSISMGGHYEDSYVKTPEGWRFRSREFFRGAIAKSEQGRWVPSLSTVRPLASTGPVAGSLHAADYLEIGRLVSHYAYGLDTGAADGYAYADLFTPEASLFGRPRTRDERRALTTNEPHGPDYTRHFLTNVLIEPAPGGARGKQYLAVIDVGEDGGQSSIFLGGRYEDVYVKTAQGWRFASRNLTRANAPPPASQPPSAPR